MKKTVTYKDFPVSKETNSLRIWKGLEIDQKAKITIGKNEEIFESRVYPFKEGKDKIKVLSKINNETKQITFIITSNNIKTNLQSSDMLTYHKLIKNLEEDLQSHIIVDEENFLTGKQIYKQIK